MIRALIVLILLFSLAPARADIPIDPREERQGMQRQLDQDLKGMDPPHQRAKVQQMLADFPKQRADLDKQIQESEAAERSGKRGIPTYMLRKQHDYLNRHEKFLREWLDGHREGSYAPSSPAMAVGWVFLAGGLLLGGRRVLRPA